MRWASALALAVAACGGTEPRASPSSPAELLPQLGSAEGPGEIRLWGDLEGCVVEVRPGVPRSIRSICYLDGGGTRGPAIGGQLMLVDGEYLVLGERRYGPIAPSSRVVIDADGVHVGGVRLGSLPEGIPDPPDRK